MIRELEFLPGNAFNVITGETGAGKSILLGALGLVLGERSDSVSTKDNEHKCVIEAKFDVREYGLEGWFEDNDLDYSNELLLRREITPTGKSRGFVNDTPVQLSQMKELGKYLIDIHSQHDNLDLFQKAFQFQVIDSYAGIIEKRTEYQENFKKLKELRKQYAALGEKADEHLREKEFKQFLLDELLAANPADGELELLEEEQSELSHAEGTLQKLALITNALSNSEPSVIDHAPESKNLFILGRTGS